MQGSFNVWTDHKKGHSKVGGTTALWMNGWMDDDDDDDDDWFVVGLVD